MTHVCDSKCEQNNCEVRASSLRDLPEADSRQYPLAPKCGIVGCDRAGRLPTFAIRVIQELGVVKVDVLVCDEHYEAIKQVEAVTEFPR